jgi:hypothetical protein
MYRKICGKMQVSEIESESEASQSGREYAIDIFNIFLKNRGDLFTWEGVIESFQELCRISAELSYQGKQNLIDIASEAAKEKFLLLVAEHREKEEQSHER